MLKDFLKSNLSRGKMFGLIIFDVVQAILTASTLLGIGILIRVYRTDYSEQIKINTTAVLLAYAIFAYLFSIGYSFYKTKVAILTLNTFFTSSINGYSIIKRSSPDRNFKLYYKSVPEASINAIFFISNLIEAAIKFVLILAFLWAFNLYFGMISTVVIGVLLLSYIPFFTWLKKRSCLFPSNFSNEFLKYKYGSLPSNIKYLYEENQNFYIKYRPITNILKSSYQPFSTLVADISLIVIIVIMPFVEDSTFDDDLIFLFHSFLMLSNPIFLLLKSHKLHNGLTRSLNIIQMI